MPPVYRNGTMPPLLDIIPPTTSPLLLSPNGCIPRNPLGSGISANVPVVPFGVVGVHSNPLQKFVVLGQLESRILPLSLIARGVSSALVASVITVNVPL